ncbi:MAG: oleate hydratase [bacterium]
MGANTNKIKAYLIGGGIASLAAAAYLIKDGGIAGENITIFEASNKLGGSLDGGTLKKNVYFARGIRIFEEKIYLCTFDLFSFIPSLNNPQTTIKEEFFKFNKENKIYSKSRLIANGKKLSAKPLKLNFRDRISLLKILIYPEFSLKNTRINDYFTPAFFESNFWIEFCTVFAFQPWNSLMEFRRYALRILHDLPALNTTKPIRDTSYCQYDSIIVPTVRWLKNKGVQFETECEVENIKFRKYGDKKAAVRIYCQYKKRKEEIQINKEDLVFTTLGSMTENSEIGSIDKPPRFIENKKNPSWNLWKNISKNNPEFGNPYNFCNDINKSKWVSFTITTRDTLIKSIKKLTKQETGTEGPITMKNSNWLLTIGIPRQPYFSDQPNNLSVCWGYGLFPDRKGDFVNKNMSDCNGKEILQEICGHFGFSKVKTEKIITTSECVPCLMPYITSQFSPRKKGDRPEVVPEKALNFAFLGQYVEIPNEIVFTVEYSIRSAQIAVYRLLNLDKKPAPIYKGQYNLKVVWNAIKTAFR